MQKGVEGSLMVIWIPGWMIQEDDPVSTNLVDVCNGFNKLILLTMLWTVRN